MHLKRQKIPKSWQIERKGTKYVVKPKSDLERGVPLLIVIRNMLGIAQNRKEVKRAIHLKQILINNKPARDEKNSVLLFDIIEIVPAKMHYKINISENGKFVVEEIKASESGKKISKVINKKVLNGKKTQLNLIDGNNFISDIKCNVNDSVLINLKDRKIEKCIPMKEKSKVIVFEGKHSGETGTIESIDIKKKICGLLIDGKKVDVLIKQLMIIEQN